MLTKDICNRSGFRVAAQYAFIAGEPFANDPPARREIRNRKDVLVSGA
jgi:hypothetical protein